MSPSVAERSQTVTDLEAVYSLVSGPGAIL